MWLCLFQEHVMQVIDQPESFNLLNTLLFNIPGSHGAAYPSSCAQVSPKIPTFLQTRSLNRKVWELIQLCNNLVDWMICTFICVGVRPKTVIMSSYFVTVFTAASDPIPWSDELRSKEYIIPWSKLKYLCENIGPWILGIDSPGNQYGQRYSKLDDCPYFSMDRAWQVLSPAPASYRTLALWASSVPGVMAPGSPHWLPTVWPTPIKTVRATLHIQ